MADSDSIPPMGTSYALATPPGVEDSKPPEMDMQRTIPRQISTGTFRGTQTITGQLIVSDPTTNNPVMTISGIDQNQIFTDPVSQVNQIVLGKLSDGRYGMKVAPTGVNVLTASDSELIFNSSQNVFKIVKTGTAVIPGSLVPGSSSFVTVRHDLNYVPLVWGFAQYNASIQPLPTIALDTSTGLIQAMADIENVTSTSFELWSYNVSVVPNISATTVRYYILQETASVAS
jgi:hypothetical protein